MKLSKRNLILILVFFVSFFTSKNLLGQDNPEKYEPYDAQKKKVIHTPKDTVVKVERLVKKPGTFMGDLLQYLSPIKVEKVDSIYSLYSDDAPFYTHPSNHATQTQLNRMDSSAYSEGYWDQIYHIANHKKKYKKDTLNRLTKVVYGYHPYWMGSAYKDYNFNLLTRVAYFSLPVDPKTGNLSDTRYWNETELIGYAHEYDCAVDLCISNFGNKNNDVFLKDFHAQKTLVVNIINLITIQGKKGKLLKKADGVNINFEEVPKARKEDFTNFIAYLRQELTKVNPDFKITITIPAIDWRNAFDIANLKPYVDYYFVMGYDFYGKYSAAAGPTSLLFSGGEWTKNNIDNTIKNYIKLGADPKRLILGLPYYGNEWITKSADVPSDTVKFVRALTYSEINTKYADKYIAHYDSTSHSIYYIYRNGNEWRQCWTDNELTLSLKYDYIKEKGLGGLGIWALGYDNNFNELWYLIKDKFVAAPDTSTDIHVLMSRTLEYDVSKKSLEAIDKTSPEYTKRFYDKIDNFWHFAALFFAVIMTFAIVGFIRAISDFDVRFVLFNKEIRVYMFFILLSFLTLVLLRILKVLTNSDIVLLLAVLIGISAALIILKIGNMKRKKHGEERP